MKTLIFLGVALLALFSGLAVALYSWGALAVVMPIIFFLLVLIDYRVGATSIFLILPFLGSTLMPNFGGHNPLPYAVGASVAALLIAKAFKMKELIGPPRVLLICLAGPLLVGAFLAMPHLVEAQRNFPGLSGLDSMYEKTSYLKIFLISPVLYVILSLLLANAVRDSKRPEVFVNLLAIAALIPALAIITLVVFLGIDLESLQSQRGFLGVLGLHANEFGKLLAFAFGPLLYVSFATKGLRRLIFVIATTTVLVGILLTFTRAAYVAVVIVMAIFLFQRKQPGLVLAMTLIIAVLSLAAPSAFLERITTGIEEQSEAGTSVGSMRDKLTAGRIGAYQLLLPEVIRSPLWGQGTGSTAWSKAVTSGRYFAQHPHNMYLEAAMDIGLIGLGLLLYFYVRLLDGLTRLSNNPDLSSEMQGFFGGAKTAYIGILVLSLAGGQWYPHPEQGLMWLALGIAFAYWPWVEKQRQLERDAVSNRGNSLRKHAQYRQFSDLKH